MKPARTTVRHLPGRPKDASKRSDIVRAASVLFMKNGYELTSMEAVAKKAVVSKLTVYSHFANKDELFKEVIQSRCAKLATPENFIAMAGRPVEKALQQIGYDYTALIFTQDSIRLHAIMQAEVTRHPQMVRIFFDAGPKRVREGFARLLDVWNDKKQLSIKDTAKATEQFFSLLKGEMMMRVMLLEMPLPNQTLLKAHVRSAVEFFLAAYRFKSSSGKKS